MNQRYEGLLYIPALAIVDRVYRRDSGTTGQDIVDKSYSAVIFNWGNLSVIADHQHQANFSNLNRVTPKRTKAYLVRGTKTSIYICDSSEIGHIRNESGHNRLYDSEWKPVHLKYSDGLCIYTCRDRESADIINIRLTHWKQLR